jgi:Asp-tRNA(Asn)/Glu-tRNA(Gln) amidotransferase A subunit family amidase
MDPQLDATAQAELVRSGEVSPLELVEASIERIEALNGDLGAVIHPLFEEALETDRLTARSAASPSSSRT